MKFVIRSIYAFVFVLGVTLLGINISGLFISLRNPAIYEQETPFENDITLSPTDFYRIISTNDLPSPQYVTEATRAVKGAIAHYWEVEGIEKYNLRIPLYENYILYFLFLLHPELDKRWEFCNYHKAIERGVGYCSQEALILDNILAEKDIQAQIVEFPWLHVIVTAKVDQEKDIWWVLDPDYGVVIPHNLTEISKEPNLIRAYYAYGGYDEKEIRRLMNIFDTDYRLHEDVDSYLSADRCRLERNSYLLTWLFPLIFMAVGSFPYVRNLRSTFS